MYISEEEVAGVSTAEQLDGEREVLNVEEAERLSAIQLWRLAERRMTSKMHTPSREG